MAFLKPILGGIAAVVAGEFLALWWMLRPINPKPRAIGLPVLLLLTTQSTFWIFALLIFAALFAAGRLHNRALSFLLFWIPAVGFSSVGLTVACLITYAIFRFKPH